MLTSVYETLRSAGRELVLELGERPSLPAALETWREAAADLAADPGATENQLRNTAEALALARPATIAERVLDLGALRCRGERAAAYEAARRAVERAALEELAARDRDLLQELLVAFASAYDEAKRREAVVDFEDLQLAARDLLRNDPAVREEESLRFRIVMVDEFQDTNALQCDIVDLLTDGSGAAEVFTVGDEFQSIYGFRHADVDVFRARREDAPQPLVLRRNYRSRPEVLAAVNHLFEPAFGSEYQPLTASGDFPDPVFGHPVELLVTDKPSYADSGEHWRRGEARHIAARVRELVDTDAAQPGEIVLLFAAGTDAEIYEEELRRAGLPTFRATGRGYFGQQQVVDLLSYMRLLQNRYDDKALATVLASPFVGVSNDTLLLLRRNATRRPLFTALEKELPDGLAADDERLAARLSAAVRADRRRVRADLARAAVRADPRRARLRPGGARALGRPAAIREPPQARPVGPGVRDGSRSRHRELRPVRPRPGDRRREGARGRRRGGGRRRRAPAHDPRGQGARVQGRDRRRRRPRHRWAAFSGRDPGAVRRPVRLPDGAPDARRPSPRVRLRGGPRRERDAGARREAAPLLRRDDACDRPPDRVGGDRSRSRRRPRDADRLGDRAARGGGGDRRSGPRSRRARAWGSALARQGEPVRRGGAACRGRPSSRAAEDDDQLSLFGELPAGELADRARRCPPLEPIPLPPMHVPRRLSYSAIAQFDSCSYRYYAERVLGLRPREERTPAAGDGATGLAATEIGDAAHRLLESVPLHDPAPPPAEQLAATVREWYPAVTEQELVADRGLRRRVLPLDARPPDRRASRHPAGAAVRLRARRRPPARPARRAVARRTGGRSSSTTRRTSSASASPPT